MLFEAISCNLQALRSNFESICVKFDLNYVQFHAIFGKNLLNFDLIYIKHISNLKQIHAILKQFQSF